MTAPLLSSSLEADQTVYNGSPPYYAFRADQSNPEPTRGYEKIIE